MATPPTPEEINALLTAFRIESVSKNVLANPALFTAFQQVVKASGLTTAEKNIGTLLYNVAGGISESRAHRRDEVAKYIGNGQLRITAQVTAAIDYIKKHTPDAVYPPGEFEKACGLGVYFTNEQIEQQVKVYVEKNKEKLLRDRYLIPIGDLLSGFREEGDWAWTEGAILKQAMDKEVLALLGPKNSDDEKRNAEANAAKRAADKEKSKANSATKTATTAVANSTTASSASSSSSASSTATLSTHSVGTVEQILGARELQSAVNSQELIDKHRLITKGIVRTRFPPEPNGYLHIGHAKSMNLNFDMAFKYLGVDKGETIFRYDDTNPDAESQEYIDNQAENVAWMGWKPVKVTHSADYFHELYAFALQLIKKGSAYVCHQTKEQMEVSRKIAEARDGRDPHSPWRNRPVEESLREFQAMRDGFYEEGTATLRLKIDMTSLNPTLWDPVAYRIKYTPHPHTGKEWCIYPSYDYSHCLIDSLENIDYSLCTLEFEIRRDLYYWVLEQLNLWRPHVWEFSRLNITYVQLSKRKILKLVNDGTVRGWDDPRIPTINGLRRRGYTSQSINAFCRDIGVTRNDNTIDYRKLEYHVRLHLDEIAKRNFIVLKPLKITLTNVPTDYCVTINAPDFPRDAALGTHAINLTNTVYIDQEDFRLEDSADYFGLALNKTCGLRYAGYVTVTELIKDSNGNVVELKAEYDHERKANIKVKGNLHWVSSHHPHEPPATAEVRLYDHLFTTETPGSTGDWESELNPQSEIIVSKALVTPCLVTPGALKLWDHFQFERVGFFVTDKDSDFTNGKLVFNLTVNLKEANDVKKIKGSK